MTRHFYLQELPEDVMDILRADTDDPILASQDYEVTPSSEEVATVINYMCKHGSVIVFEHSNVCILTTRKNAHIGSFDTHLGAGATAKDAIKAYRAYFEWLPDNTHYLRVETRTPLEKYAKVLAKAVGAKVEGTLSNSYRTKDNKMVNEYIVGHNINRLEATSCQ
jgi:hypothetical protein